MKKRILLFPLALLLAISLAAIGCPAPAPAVEPAPVPVEEIKIGVLLPLTGPLAPVGRVLREGAELAADIVNNKYPELDMEIAGWEGIPNLDGAKIRLIFADHRAEPARGADLAERLIVDEQVVGLLGAYNSSVTKTVSLVAERHGIPHLNADSTSPALSKRGFEWFWRTTPHETFFTAELFNLLEGLIAGKGPGVGPIPKEELAPLAMAAENTEWGAAALAEVERFAAERGWEIVEAFKYPHAAADLTSESKRLIASGANSWLFAPYVADAILFIKTLKGMGVWPNLIWGQNAGFIVPDFYHTLGAAVNGILSRAVFSPEIAKVRPLAGQVNALFRDRIGEDLGGDSARNFVGVQAWAIALNNAGSTDPEALQKAFNELYVPGEELIVPWLGIRFGSPFPGDTNQNYLGSGIIGQYQGFPEDGRFEIIYPFELASADLIYPFPGW